MVSQLDFGILDADGPAPDLIVQFAFGRVTIELEAIEDLKTDYGLTRDQLVTAIKQGILDTILNAKLKPHQDTRIGSVEMGRIILSIGVQNLLTRIRTHQAQNELIGGEEVGERAEPYHEDYEARS